MPEAELTYIEITADGIAAGGPTPKGTTVSVSRIGEDSARRLIKGGKAKAVAKPKEATNA